MRIHDSFRNVSVAPVTGPLGPITGKRVLALIDAENLVYSARSLGLKISFARLGERLHQASKSCTAHVFYSHDVNDSAWDTYFTKRGFIIHPRIIEFVQTHMGVKKRANSDNDLVFHAGKLASRSSASVLLIGSGDGDLVTDLARLIGDTKQVVTLSLAGSTSYRLDSRANPSIASNIEIGLDLCHAFPTRVTNYSSEPYGVQRRRLAILPILGAG